MRHIAGVITRVFQAIGYGIATGFIYTIHVIWNFGINSTELKKERKAHTFEEYALGGNQSGWIFLFWAATLIGIGILIAHGVLGHWLWEDVPEEPQKLE